MLGPDRFALNRIVAPQLDLDGFLALAADLGVANVELRNDLEGRGVIDDLSPAEVVDRCRRRGLRVISINALQRFNVAALLDRAAPELAALQELAVAIDCPAIVLCPNNDPDDKRSAQRRFDETVAALEAFAPSFERHALTGLVEPLGFAISSLSSTATAALAIEQSGLRCYRTVHDTFHAYIGPDRAADPQPAGIGLVHVSGVEVDIPIGEFRDSHRVLPGPNDRTGAKRQVHALYRGGYDGFVSFEPFAPRLQSLPTNALAAAIKNSISYLASPM